MNNIVTKSGKILFTLSECKAYIDTLEKKLSDKPPADKETVKHGRWIISNLYAHCSECSVAYDLDTFQRLIPMHENVPRCCSYCGARMDGD